MYVYQIKYFNKLLEDYIAIDGLPIYQSYAKATAVGLALRFHPNHNNLDMLVQEIALDEEKEQEGE